MEIHFNISRHHSSIFVNKINEMHQTLPHKYAHVFQHCLVFFVSKIDDWDFQLKVLEMFDIPIEIYVKKFC